MSRLVHLLAGAALGSFVVALTAAALEPNASRTAKLSTLPPTTFLNAEYWRCPEGNLAALEQAADSIWRPLFDELVQEGKFLDWGMLVPVRAFTFPLKEGRRSREETPLPWNWVASWRAESEQAFTAAWTEFISRLQAKFPDDPRPFRFCTDLTIVQYEVRP